MSKAKATKPGFGRILDAWVAPENAGEPVGCVATSFTFSPTIFEEECLGRFLQLETDASEDGPAFLIEREEKLSQLMCAAALVDQHHARGVRSLRWDLLAARVPRGILHAKVSLLLWSRRLRLIVASANLTEDGYRRNHEIFGALDYHEGSEAPLPLLADMVSFLREAAVYAQIADSSASPAIQRWNSFLIRVLRDSRLWGAAEPAHTLARPRAFAVLTGPERPSAFARLREQWPDNSPPAEAFVVSPFFDPPEAINAPARELWALLKQRGEASAQFEVTAEDLPGEKVVLVNAPESLREAQPAHRTQISTFFRRIILEESRRLHAKCLWLQNDRAVMHMMGSSNFTSAGLGMGQTKNIEANLAFTVSRQNDDARKALEVAWLPSEDFSDDLELRWKPGTNDGEDSPSDEPLLPGAFDTAALNHDADGHFLMEFRFASKPPAGWAIIAEEESKPFTTEATWVAQGEPNPFIVTWELDRPPPGFRVNWTGASGFAWWPVNVVSNAALPPPLELRDLPLEVLIEILTSAKPLHQVLAAWIKRRVPGNHNDEIPSLDPHRRVDTSTFLLQRTRRLSWALTALRQRLAKPVVSEQALTWRLHGPIGVYALVEAIRRDAKSEVERCFLLTELCLELTRVRPQETKSCVPKSKIIMAIQQIIQGLRSEISPSLLSEQPALAEYAEGVFKKLPV
jgi:hypothetical protein